MQTTEAGFTAEARDSDRSIAHNLQVSWHNYNLTGNRTFTIGTSLIGGNDIIGANPGAIGSPGNYSYFDESQYLTSLSWERALNMPLGGLAKALAEARLTNTSGRFTPRYMGGSSELYTAILPSRPVIINAGFNYGGTDKVIPQFAGVIAEQPQVSLREGEAQIKIADYLEFFENKYLDQTAMYTGQRSDVLIGNFLAQLGMSTSQYDLDQGIQTIDFLLAPSGTKFYSIINQIVQAENGHFFQDESGIFRFENRQHWYNAPYTNVQQVIYTAEVLDAYTTNLNDAHLINVVEVRANPLQKQSSTTIYTQSGSVELGPADNDLFIEFDNPVLSAAAPVYAANSAANGSGTNLTGSVTIKSTALFAQSVKYVITNNSSQTAYITSLTIAGRQATAKYDNGIYYRAQDDSSVTAYQEQPLRIENDYIQSDSWAMSYANLILSQFSDPENVQTIVIRAKPHLQNGDLISWQGRYWRIFQIKATSNPSGGLLQELSILQRSIQTYFRIGVSSIGSSDLIAP